MPQNTMPKLWILAPLVGLGTMFLAGAPAYAAACLTPDPVELAAPLKDALKGLPEDLWPAYAGYGSPVAESPLKTFKAAKPGPWTIGYNNSFSGNAWRAGALSALETAVDGYKKAGLVKDLIVTDSNGDITTQIQQMRSMIQRGVDLIVSIPGSPTAMNAVIDEAFKAGIPVVTLDSPVTTPNAINIDMNSYSYARTTALGLAKLLDGKGTILTVQGIPGTSGSELIKAGATSIFANCPDIKIAGDLTGEWSNSVAQSAVLQWLSSNPQQIDGIWQQGSMFMGSVLALQQAGRPLVPVVIGNPDQNALAFWRDNLDKGFKSAGTANPPGAQMQIAVETGLRVLQGQGLKVSSIVVAPPAITKDNLGEWVKPEFTLESNGVGEPPAGTWLPADKLAEYFVTPAALK